MTRPRRFPRRLLALVVLGTALVAGLYVGLSAGAPASPVDRCRVVDTRLGTQTWCPSS